MFEAVGTVNTLKVQRHSTQIPVEPFLSRTVCQCTYTLTLLFVTCDVPSQERAVFVSALNVAGSDVDLEGRGR